MTVRVFLCGLYERREGRTKCRSNGAAFVCGEAGEILDFGVFRRGGKGGDFLCFFGMWLF
jgi:hypothetical protein